MNPGEYNKRITIYTVTETEDSGANLGDLIQHQYVFHVKGSFTLWDYWRQIPS